MQETQQQFKYPTYWDRVIARIIDNLIFFGIGFLAVKLTTHADSDDYRQKTSEIIFYIVFVRWFLYYPIMEAYGGSIGKRMQGLKTISARDHKTGSIIQGYFKLFKFAWPLLLMMVLAAIFSLTGSFNTVTAVITLLPLAYFAYLLFAVPGNVDANNQGAHDRASRLMVIKV